MSPWEKLDQVALITTETVVFSAYIFSLTFTSHLKGDILMLFCLTVRWKGVLGTVTACKFSFDVSLYIDKQL